MKKSTKYATDEGITVGSRKTDIEAAYKKYGLQEFQMSKITSLGLRTFDIVLMGVDLADTFLYIDNHNVFSESYPGVDYWGGLGAFIFILDHNNLVVKFALITPTSG